MEHLVHKLESLYKGSELEAFQRSHEAWLKYRKLQSEFMASPYEDGSIQPLIYNSEMNAITLARVADLEAEFEMFIGQTEGEQGI